MWSKTVEIFNPYREIATRQKPRKLRLNGAMVAQKVMGLCLLAISALIIWFAAQGNSPEERDATAVLLLAPIGLYMLFARGIVITI